MTIVRHRRVAAVLLGALTLTSCGFPTEDSPSPVAADERPDDLGPSNSDDAAPTDDATIWLIQDDQLVPRARQVTTPLEVSAVIDALRLGVTAAEIERGMRSALPDASVLVDATTAGGTAIVQLTGSFLEIPPGDQVLALGQIVLTLTDLRGVGRVRFEIDGEPVATPLPDGTSTEDSVSREDFRVLVA